jgi:hypothetical protein
MTAIETAAPAPAFGRAACGFLASTIMTSVVMVLLSTL